MLDWMRTKMGPVVVGLVIGFIAFVFVFEGVFRKSPTAGLGDGAVAGIVNGDTITARDFNRALERRIEMFRGMLGGKVTEQQLQAFRVRQAVFEQLVDRRLMIQAAEKAGLVPSDAEVREFIRKMTEFQTDGKFDLGKYRDLLAANGYSDSRFESMVREDLTVSQWERFFAERAQVSEAEALREYLVTNDKRDLRYVLVSQEAVGQVFFSAEDVTKLLADAEEAKVVQSRYDAAKETQFKGQPEGKAKEAIARVRLAEKRADDLRGAVTKLAEAAAAAMGDDGKLKALLKPYGLEPKQTGMVAPGARFLPGIGEAPDLLRDAFATKSPIDPREGGKAKSYTTGQQTVVAQVSASQKADPAKFAAERENLMRQLTSRKERELFEAWRKELKERAKIERNDAMVGEA